MASQQRLTDDDIKALADRVLGPEMADLGFAGVDVEHRDLYDDGSSLFVDVHVASDVPAPFDPDRISRLRRLLFDALLDQGDERFPHFGLKREGDEPPEAARIPVDP